MYIEVTDEEFFLLRVAVDAAKDKFKEYANNAGHEEDEDIDNQYYLKYLDLQKKFPSPDDDSYGITKES